MGWAADLDAPDGTMWLIGCGHRKWRQCGTISAVLERVRHSHPLLTVIEGGAPGADQCVQWWAADQRARGVHWIHIPARWTDYPQHVRWQAGHARNQVMVDQLVEARTHSHGVAVVAFKDTLDSRLFGDRPQLAEGGTEDCIRRAWAADLPVWWQRGDDGPPTVCLPVARLL